MAYALILIEKPADTKTWSNWLSLVEHSKEIEKGVQRLPGCAWLIDLNDGLPTLCKMVQECLAHKLLYRVSFSDNAPTFIS